MPIDDQTFVLERGSTKPAIHSALTAGECDEFVDSYEPQNGSIIIYVKPNLNPRKTQHTIVPDAEYGNRILNNYRFTMCS